MQIDDIVKKLSDREENRKKQEEVIIERADEWKETINRLLSTEDGKLLAKYLIKFCRVFTPDNSSNQIELVENNGKRKVYLELIRPYLFNQTKKDIE
jgi:hypothetical protein